MASVSLEDVTKVYGDGTRAVSDLTHHIEDGECLVIVGATGCGKSTTLRMLAGLDVVTSGKITIGSDVVNDWAPRDRDVSMVFQTHALYPHMTVSENLGFAMRISSRPGTEIRRKLRRTAEMLSISELLDRRPRTL